MVNPAPVGQRDEVDVWKAVLVALSASAVMTCLAGTATRRRLLKRS
jgi:hypothetical protein